MLQLNLDSLSGQFTGDMPNDNILPEKKRGSGRDLGISGSSLTINHEMLRYVLG